MRLLLLRHGQTHGNTVGALDTAFPGADLTELGVRQAEAAALALHGREISGLYVSPLVRTHQTAAPLAAKLGLDPVVLHGVQEIQAGAFEMATDEESILGYIGTVADWIERRLDTRMRASESGHEFLARYDAAVSTIHADGHGSALVVSHGAAIRTWVANRVADSTTHAMAAEGFANTACIELEGSPGGRWEVVEWQAEPIGGEYLEDEAAPDPTGQPTE